MGKYLHIGWHTELCMNSGAHQLGLEQSLACVVATLAHPIHRTLHFSQHYYTNFESFINIDKSFSLAKFQNEVSENINFLNDSRFEILAMRSSAKQQKKNKRSDNYFIPSLFLHKSASVDTDLSPKKGTQYANEIAFLARVHVLRQPPWILQRFAVDRLLTFSSV